MLCPAHSAPAEGGWRRWARPRSARWRSGSSPSWSNRSGEAVQGLPAVPATRVIEVGRLFRIVSVRRVLSVTVLSAGAGICAYTYIADILGHAVGAAGWVFVVLLVVYGVGAFAGSLGSGVVTDRVGPDRTTAASVGMLVVVLVLVPAVRTYVLMVVLVLVWGARVRRLDGSPTAQTGRGGRRPTLGRGESELPGYLSRPGTRCRLGRRRPGTGHPATQLPFVTAALAASALVLHLIPAVTARVDNHSRTGEAMQRNPLMVSNSPTSTTRRQPPPTPSPCYTVGPQTHQLSPRRQM